MNRPEQSRLADLEIITEPTAQVVGNRLAPHIVLIGVGQTTIGSFRSIWTNAVDIQSFDQIEEAVKWIQTGQLTDLLIVDESLLETNQLAGLRAVAGLTFRPVLLLCLQPAEDLCRAAVRAGLTDVISLGDDEIMLERKLTKLAILTRQLNLTTPADAPTLPASFRLPTWKRSMDLVFSGVACLIISPLLLIVALLIKLDSRGPVFYLSRRVGSNYRVFPMYKFRTMAARADSMLSDLAAQNIYQETTEDAEPAQSTNSLCDTCRLAGSGCQRPLFDQDRYICEQQYQQQDGSATFLKFRNDPRITRLGRFLRNSSIDELPQLLNILLGDMSLVGNRPLPLYEAEKLTDNASVKRFSGPAGLTGLWQVEKRAQGNIFMSEQERIDLDIQYAETFSFAGDMNIMYRTIFSLWQKENV
jgi:lipopolysaccharide/colanic/teichoic acid biosynthesis glycosyltransferase